MITPAYPNQRKHDGILAEFKKQLLLYPHYIYVEEGNIYSDEQPQIKDSESYYEVFENSSNTVLFWSSKTRLHSVKAIYTVEDRILTFKTVIDMTQGDFDWVGRNLHLAAVGARIVLKEPADWVKIPRKFMDIDHPELIVEGEFVRFRLKDFKKS